MILGLGSDIIDIRRVEHTCKRFGSRFLERVFTEREQQKASLYKDTPKFFATLAKRFAAKEACAKALATGIGAQVRFKDIQVDNLSSGQPTITLSGKGSERLTALTPDGYQTQLNISLSDDYPLAQAVVIISAVA